MNLPVHFVALGLLSVFLTAPTRAQVVLRTFTGSLGADAGDVNKDGIPDLVIASGSTATVISGKDWSTIHTLQKTTSGNATITSVAGGTDINQDGHDDVIVGHATAWLSSLNQQAGIVRVWSGKDGKVLYEIGGFWVLDRLGTSVAALGDLNKDGFPDFAAGGDNGPSGQTYGLVLVWSGKDGRLLYVFTGAARPEGLGLSVQSAGDVDNDGTPDIIAGSRNRGIARAYSGKTGKQLHVFTTNAVAVTVDGLGDVNNDGHSDLLVATGSGVVVFSGKNGSTLYTRSGIAGGSAGDMNVDGYADFMVSTSGTSSTPGTVEAFSGKDGSRLLMLSSNTPPGFGRFTRSVGDFNKDGARDFLVGATTSVLLYSGSVLPFGIDWTEFSISQGGTQNMFLNAGTKNGLKTYLIMGSDKGTSPGFRFGPFTVPLNPGAYLSYTLNSPNTVIQRSLGSLDGQGKGSAALNLPRNIPSSLVGTTVHHAFIVVTLAPFSFDFVSNPVSLKLLK